MPLSGFAQDIAPCPRRRGADSGERTGRRTAEIHGAGLLRNILEDSFFNFSQHRPSESLRGGADGRFGRLRSLPVPLPSRGPRSDIPRSLERDSRKTRLRLILGAAILIASLTRSDGRPARNDYPITPVPFTAVKVSDGFWAPRIETNRAVTIPAIFQKCEETGRIDNFAIAGGLMKGEYKGERYNDTDVYKTVEGASYSLMVRPDPELDRYLDGVIAKIAAAQEPDGYLYTPRTASPGKVQPGTGDERWSELAVSHELYNAGHLYEAAAAHFMATGKHALLDVALKNADLVARTFGAGAGKRQGFPGHQEIELALVKLYRLTGKASYLDLAKYFLDQRGHGLTLKQYPPGNRFAIYNDATQIQAHKSVLEQDEAVGHAVRLTYMASAMADIAALTGDRAYFDAVGRLWQNVVGKKMCLTGGIGSRHDRERFGEDYELPNLTGYLETCASIGMAFWNHRMFLLTGEAGYLDVMERVMYNGVLSGVSLDGTLFFYPNPLESDGRYRFNKGRAGRAPWFGVACCPGNVSRFLPSMPGHVYATKGDALYVNMFVAGEAKIEMAGRAVGITQETRYPWDGAVRLTVDPERRGQFALHIRVPGWARERPVPTDLYSYADRAVEGETGVALRVNGQAVALDMDKGFARIRRTWRKGDKVELVLPMAARRVVAHPAVKDDEGFVAVERGPLVYCAEAPDNGGRALNLVLPEGAALRPVEKAGLLGGITVLEGEGLAAEPSAVSRVREEAGKDAAADDEEEVPPSSRRALAPGAALAPHPLVLIPYYAWAHRGDGEMAVWLFRSVPHN
ncbi:MAG: glycoside hydrolase family 127 protein [Candidatus Aminicenantes bacterium]|nr:MAG: glycoside hydrolase family 127 protein [Candidatus Aminicenantes bacterium]